MNKMVVQVIAILLIGSASILAQGTGESQLGMLRHELERTDEILTQAREAVRASNNVLAAQALERGVKYQATARQAFQSEAYALALQLTKKAREQAAAAISNSRMAGQLEGVVTLRLERARDMLERARELWSGPLTPATALIFDQARANLAQAWQFSRQGQHRASLKLVEQVEQAAQRLQSIARSRDRATNDFERRQEDMLRTREQVREMLADCESEAAREHMRVAEEAYQMAQKLQGEDHPAAALMAMNRAKEALQRASRQCANGDRLQEQYHRLVNQAERLTDQIGPNDDFSRKLLDQARAQLELCRKYLAENKSEPALVSLQAARLALRQAQKAITRGN